MKQLIFLTMITCSLLMFSCSENGVGPDDGPHGVLHITSQPTGALIHLDQKNTGLFTPQYINATGGSHNIILTMENYNPWESHEWVDINDTTEVEAYLTAHPTKLYINSEPSGASVYVQGNFYDYTPCLLDSLYWGLRPRDIWIRYAGYFPYHEVFEHRDADIVNHWNITLEPCPSHTFVYGHEQSLYTVQLDGIDPVVLAANIGTVSSAPVRSPDNQYVAVLTGDTHILVINSAGAIVKDIIAAGSRAYDFRWSADSRYLAWGVYIKGIYLFDAQTQNVKLVYATSGYCYNHSPAFSPDGQWIAFAHHEWESRCWIYKVKIDGTGAKMISDRFGTLYDEWIDLNWVDNDLLVYKTRSGLYTLNPSQSSAPQKVIDDYLYRLAFSADGEHFAYCSDYNGADSLHIGTTYNWTFSSGFAFDDIARIITWVPDQNAFLVYGYEGCYWLTLTGRFYHLNDPDGPF
ncbi:PEGA domain-containing protein [Patescibacteria group bacterium]|nr:PEGA domain-containing protein [Patescibacteria group bacterium]MBU0964113.1 PEGA domain-containing protein [Patescibacteria group bacterium]